MKRKIKCKENNKLNIREDFISAKAITLITLVITIIILIILAGVIINVSLGENGIFNKAKQAKNMYNGAVAKEKLELVLEEARIDKETINEYNSEEYLDNLLKGQGIIVNENEVIVDNYNFKIDRERLVILEELGETNIKIMAKVQEYLGKNENGKYEASILLILESKNSLKSVIIQNPDGTTFEMQTDEEKLGKDITVEFDEEYIITVITSDGETESRKIIERSEETIKTAEELEEFRDKVNNGLTYEGKTLNVINDLDLRSVCNIENSWNPIGGCDINGLGENKFSGTFNGNKHIIDYLYIDTESDLAQGLFGYIVNATITGVVIGENCSISANNSVGGIVGYAVNSKILYCGNNANINCNGSQIGGIVGELDCGEIRGCYNKANISGDYNVAGICGVAGIYEGMNENNIIQYSYNTGKIKGETQNSGICGNLVGYARIENCYNKGEILGANNCGGIAGRSQARRYINNQEVTNQEVAKSQIRYTCNIGKVNASGTRIGGICGYNQQYCIIEDSHILKGLEIKKELINASNNIGVSSNYLGKIVGHAYSENTSYINGNGEITNETNIENGVEDITDTVYYIVNGYDEGESQYWSKDDATQPKLKWEL